MPFVAALSEHPLAAHATGEVIGQVLESLVGPPEVAVLAVAGSHRRHLAQITAAVRATLAPRALIGAAALGVLAGEREVEDHPAIALWVGSATAATAVRLDAVRGPDGWTVSGIDPGAVDPETVLVLLAAPSFPAADALDDLAAHFGHLAVVGGAVSAGVRPGDTQLVCDDRIVTTGAVGLLVDARHATSVVASQGCRPIGAPLVVTRAEGTTIHELAGRPVLDRLDDVLLGLDDEEQAVVSRGLHLGRVIDEHRAEFGPGDFVIGAVTEVDRVARSIGVADPIEVGATVQFQVRDARAADQGLRAVLAGHQSAGALVFAGNGRGVRLYGDADHDAEIVSAVVDGRADVGFFCAAVFAPGLTSSLGHGSTVAVALFEDR